MKKKCGEPLGEGGFSVWRKREMERPTITIAGEKKEMRTLTGRDWRIFAEQSEKGAALSDADFLEKQAEFISGFYEGVTAEEVLNMPLEEILPASTAIKNYIMRTLTVRFEQIEKNSGADKAQ